MLIMKCLHRLGPLFVCSWVSEILRFLKFSPISDVVHLALETVHLCLLISFVKSVDIMFTSNVSLFALVLTAFPVRLSYCTAKKIPNRKCNLGEVVVTMEGEFPFALNPVGEIACQCSETLVLKTDRPHGSRTQQVYSCGQV
mgnify:CR=1 FL=1